MNYRKEWAEGEIEAGTLLDAIDELRERVTECESSAVAKELIAARAELGELNARIQEARELMSSLAEVWPSDAGIVVAANDWLERNKP